jgi:hypothetical protein
LSFLFDVQYFHCLVYCTACVSCIKHVLCKFWILLVRPCGFYVLLVTDFECTSRLSDVLWWTFVALQLIYFTLAVYVYCFVPWFKCYFIALVVLYAIFMLVFLNSFVIICVPGPQYAKVTYFVFCVSCGILMRGVMFLFLMYNFFLVTVVFSICLWFSFLGLYFHR